MTDAAAAAPCVLGPGTPPPGLILAAPASGSGKTTVTLGLVRHLARRGVDLRTYKAGPDYIDPRFHARAGGRPCVNLDVWGMRPATLARLAAAPATLALVEGVMGLFDGAAGGRGSTAELAARLGWPAVLVVDVRAQAQSAAATVLGFARYRADVTVAGVIANRVGGDGHAALVREALAPLGLPLLGALPRDEGLARPDRHLGLVPADEQDDLDGFLDRAADLVGRHIDVPALVALARPGAPAAAGGRPADAPPVPPLGQRIAIADDIAFPFAYPHVLDGWRAAGAELVPFSPLADQPPADVCDAVYLPGGYPELHAGRLAAATRLMRGLHVAAARGAVVYGECGGYMLLGRTLTDAAGATHAMADLLPVATSFADRRLHLGYRHATLTADGPLGAAGGRFRGHEFHYAALVDEDRSAPLFQAGDARGSTPWPAGCRRGTVMGSFLHLLDRAAPGAPAA